MTYGSLIEIVTAAHLAKWVTGSYQQRGGLLLVAPAGQLKSTAVEILDFYPDAKIVSDINVQSMIRLRDDIVAGDIATLAFTDLEKIYKRHSSVASNLEGIMMALVEEGFRKASFQDQRMIAPPARCTIVGAMTLRCYEQHVESWTDSGFARRFLFMHYRVSNTWKLENAVKLWERYKLDGDYSARVPTNREIKYQILPHQEKTIDRAVKHQRSKLSPRILLQKMVSVWNWKFAKEPKRADQVLSDCADALGQNGATLTL